MKNLKKICASILIIMLAFSFTTIPKVQANFFTDDWDKPASEQKTDIEKAIDSDDGGIFEKIIAKMIGGIAETVFDLTTNEKFGMGFKNYDELIFAKDSTDISPFTDEQWSSMMKWYAIISSIAGSLILIVVVIIAYKFIASGFNIEKRNEAKDSLLRLFFGAISIMLAPLFVKFLLLLNNNLVHMIIGFSEKSLDKILGNNILTNVQTGNAIATSIVIAMFAYLFFKLNVKFIIRQFTILIFTLFTPIVSIMWMINKRTIGAAIWFGQIFINIFMQFIYAFLFLMYLKFLPQSGGWAISILWAMMILPIADTLQNTLQNLVSRVAGINNDEIANRGIGMAGAMTQSLRTISYQFKTSNTNDNSSNVLGKILNKKTETDISQVKSMKTNEMATSPLKTKNVEENNNNKGNFLEEKNKVLNKNKIGNKIINTGKEFANLGMYVAEGRNFKHPMMHNVNDEIKKSYNIKEEFNIMDNLHGDDKL